ncbi:peptidyl-prolyl cis-trans isomerase [Nitrospira defluvii]|nr:peptidyl-prolyl cis-trans isomerase [Nitrospira defluvii]
MSVSILFFLLINLVLHNGCSRNDSNPLQATVAMVNDEAIILKDLLALSPQEDHKGANNVEPPDEEKAALYRALLEQLIEQKMLLQEAKRLKIQLTDAEVEERMAQLREAMGEHTFSQQTSDPETSKTDFEEAMKKNLLIEKLLDQIPTGNSDRGLKIEEDSIQHYYESHRVRWIVDEELKLRQIVVNTIEQAEVLQLNILNGADFEKTARDHSKQSNLGDGGELGYLQKHALPIEFDPLFDLEIGEISSVIKTPFGFHIVRIEARRPARTRSLEEVHDTIYNILLDQKREALFTKWMTRLRHRTKVRINEELLKIYS